jgi:glucan phosphoethanolaminetransferase (alkaline phosphatase superfamily)
VPVAVVAVVVVAAVVPVAVVVEEVVAELVLLLVLHDTVKQQTAKVVKRKFFMYMVFCGFNIQELPPEIKLAG